MSLQPKKGQIDLIGDIFLFSATLLVVIVFFMIFTAGRGQIEKQMTQNVDYAMGEVKARSLLQTVLKKDMGSEYENVNVREAISAYYSDEGSLNLKGESIDRSRSQFRQDLKQKMNTVTSSYLGTYGLEIGPTGGEKIEVSSLGADRIVTYSSPVGAQGGEVVWVTLELNQEASIYQ